jgi:hypothetical protein
MQVDSSPNVLNSGLYAWGHSQSEVSYCNVFGYWDTQFGLLIGFISIFTSRNYT